MAVVCGSSASAQWLDGGRPMPGNASAQWLDGGRPMPGGKSHACVPRRVNLAEHYTSTRSTKKEAVTTVMIRNVPNQYHRGHFMQELDRLGFTGRYDFVYLPVDRQTQCNVGYAFVNFQQPEDAEWCMKVMSGHKFTRFHQGQQQRFALVSIAHLQGIEDNLAHFEKTAVFSSSSALLQPWVRPGSIKRRPAPAEAENWQSAGGYGASHMFQENDWQCYSQSQEEEPWQQMQLQAPDGSEVPNHFIDAQVDPSMLPPDWQPDGAWPAGMGFPLAGMEMPAMAPWPPMTYTVIYVPAEMVPSMTNVPQGMTAECDATETVLTALGQEGGAGAQPEQEDVIEPAALRLGSSQSMPDLSQDHLIKPEEDQVSESSGSTMPSSCSPDEPRAALA